MKIYQSEICNQKSTITSAFTFSLFLHVLIVGVVILLSMRTNVSRIPTSYTVSLVPEAEIRGQDSSASGSATRHAIDQKAEADLKPRPPKPLVSQQPDYQKAKERIEAIEAKKRIEKIVALRKTVDISSQTVETRSPAYSPQRSGKTATGDSKALGSRKGAEEAAGGDYYSTVISKIRQHWIFPEIIDREIEAVVSIKVAKDGTVTIEKMEKSSGNPLFDRSILRAISMASPLPPPPQDIVIGVRFRP